MATVPTNDIRPGFKVMDGCDPCTVLENEMVKPGKGQAFCRIKLRNLKNGRVIDRTLKASDSMELADIIDRDAQYLYHDGSAAHFMLQDSFEQFEVSDLVFGDAKLWVKEQDICVVTLWNNVAIAVIPPNQVILRVVETDPGLKGDTSGGGNKPAKLETGAVVRVPLFLQQDELIRVDTRTSEYLSRVKE